MHAICRLYGITVTSPFVLGHFAENGEDPEIEITVDDATTDADHDTVPSGRLIASLASNRPQFSLVDRGHEGYLYRIHDFADIEIAPTRRILRCQLVEGASREILPVLLAGNVMAALLLLGGHLVFHASAVERQGRSIAFVGGSGAGKSTLAAMACLAGARLVTDDVLRVELADDGVVCYRGAAALRLRSGSKALAHAVEGIENMSADGRHLLAAEPTESDRLPLDAIFVPRLRDADHPLARTALDPKQALFTLLENPRISNWTDPATSASHFDTLASVVERVPVYLLDVPWGVNEDPEFFDRFTDLLFEPHSGDAAALRHATDIAGPN